MKKTNTNLLDRLSDLSVINKSGAESIRKSLDALNEQGKYIKDLNSSIQKKDSVNLSLVMNLKRSLADINDEDVSIEVKKGVVYISISDKLMFASGSARVNTKAEAVLAKVAKVVNDHKGLDILVEGHTDAVPISTPEFKDNWDLSAMRATSVVRLLQTKFGVDPERMTAGGRGEFEPQTANDSRAGRKQNRRTEIIVTPKLDQFFDLLAAPAAK
jgi:chemotaxis protein MotB